MGRVTHRGSGTEKGTHCMISQELRGLECREVPGGEEWEMCDRFSCKLPTLEACEALIPCCFMLINMVVFAFFLSCIHAYTVAIGALPQSLLSHSFSGKKLLVTHLTVGNEEKHPAFHSVWKPDRCLCVPLWGFKAEEQEDAKRKHREGCVRRHFWVLFKSRLRKLKFKNLAKSGSFIQWNSTRTIHMDSHSQQGVVLVLVGGCTYSASRDVMFWGAFLWCVF